MPAGLHLDIYFCVCFSYLEPNCLFCVFGEFSLVCFELSVAVEKLISEMTCYESSAT